MLAQATLESDRFAPAVTPTGVLEVGTLALEPIQVVSELPNALCVQDEAARNTLLSDRTTEARVALRTGELPRVWAPSEQATAALVNNAAAIMTEMDVIGQDMGVLRARTPAGDTPWIFDQRIIGRNQELGILERRLGALLDRVVESAF